METTFTFLRRLETRELSDLEKNVHHGQITKPESLEWLSSELMDNDCLQHWLDLASFLDSPWFSRMWIIQEVALGSKVYVRRGNHEMEWDYTMCLAGSFIGKYLRLALRQIYFHVAATPV